MCYKHRSEKPEMVQPKAVVASGKAAGSPTESNAAIRGSNAEPGLAMNYCPSCSARLTARSCKLICPSCGYYMSCSDFY
jgi:hypothetical protein